MIALIPKLLTILAGLPKIAEMLESVVREVVHWYMNQQTNKTLALIANAAAASARAKNEKDRYAAAQAWRDALSRSRVM